MGKWKINGCPRCNGTLIVDKDEDGWYELCINCAHRSDLKGTLNMAKKAVSRV
jgi:hypothetical protein